MGEKVYENKMVTDGLRDKIACYSSSLLTAGEGRGGAKFSATPWLPAKQTHLLRGVEAVFASFKVICKTLGYRRGVQGAKPPCK